MSLDRSLRTRRISLIKPSLGHIKTIVLFPGSGWTAWRYRATLFKWSLRQDMSRWPKIHTVLSRTDSHGWRCNDWCGRPLKSTRFFIFLL